MGNIHIPNSYEYDYEDILLKTAMLWSDNRDSDLWKHRTVRSVVKEWTGHNALYKMGLFRSHTKDVDINWPLPWYEKVAYTLFFPIARIIIKL